MSVDNGIYILKTGKEYRVKHISAADNLYWSNVGKTCCSSLNPARILEEFGDCKSTRDAEMAIKIAFNLVKDRGYVECGTQILNTNCFWDKIVEDGVRIAEEEITYLNGDYDVMDWEKYAKERLEQVLFTYKNKKK